MGAGIGNILDGLCAQFPPGDPGVDSLLRWNESANSFDFIPVGDLEAVWGNITGDITDQTDLVTFVEDIATTAPGLDTQVIYNNAGAFGASADLTYNNTTKVLDLNGAFSLAQVTTNAVIIGDVSGNTRGSRSIDIQPDHYGIPSAVASGDYSIVIGYGSTGNSYGSVSLGDFNTVGGGFAIGRYHTANAGCYLFGEGILGSNSSFASPSFGIGLNSTVSGAACVSVGITANVTKDNCVSVGTGIVNDTNISNCIGYQVSNYLGSNNNNIGISGVIIGSNSINLGLNLKNLYSDTVLIGNGATGSNTVAPITVKGYKGAIKNEQPQAAWHVNGDIIASSDASLGSELVTNGTFTGSATGWTLGTGWSYSANQAGKGADGTGTLSQAISVTAGKMYKLVFNCTLVVGQGQGGTFTVSLGGFTSDTVTLNLGRTKGFEYVIQATTTGSLIFTPSNTSRFGIDNVSVKEVLGGDITAYGGHKIREGTNACMGAATLVAGTVTVSTTKVTANSRIFLSGQNSSGTHGELTVSARTATTSFTITSSSGTDTRSIAWEIKEPL